VTLALWFGEDERVWIGVLNVALTAPPSVPNVPLSCPSGRPYGRVVVHPLPVFPYISRVIPSVVPSTGPSFAITFLAATLAPFPFVAATVGSEAGETAR
jgi:hypothetical protein